MLKRQENFATYLETLYALLDAENIHGDPDLLNKIKHTELLVPVIGAFSAGKSSLLNNFMGQNVLPVDLAPETELATELRYSHDPCLVAIRENGEEERLPVEALSTINLRSSEFAYLRLYLDSESLKAIAPLVLVDMPGYGSSLETHSKAIAFYLPRGVHFIVVTSIEDGTLTKSMIRRLDEVKTFDGDFTFVLSKCNLRAPAQVDEVCAHIDEQLQTYFGDDYKTLPISKGDTARFAKALVSINPNELFTRMFSDTLKNQSHDLVRQINLAANTLKNNAGQSEQELRNLQRAITALQAQQEDMQNQVHQRYSGRLLNLCLRALEDDLNQALDELTTLATSPDKSALNNVISEVIRSSLTRSLRAEIAEISSAMVDDLATGLSTVGAYPNSQALDDSIVAELSDRVKGSLAVTNQALSTWSEQLSKREADSEKHKTLYRGVSTVLAVTTSVVMPLVELAIIFLPDILRWMNSGNERQMIRNKLQEEVFPGVKAELRRKLPSILEEQLMLLLIKVNASFEAKITQQQDTIESYQQRSNANEAETNTKLKALEDLSNTVKALTTQYLYS